MTEIRWRRAAPREAARVEAFLREHSREAAPRQTGWLDWQYVRNPAGFDLRVCEEGGALVGVSGLLPCPLAVDGPPRTGAFSTNTLVAPSHRRRGLGRALHEARLQDYDWALSSGQSPENRRVYERLGFVACGDYRRAIVCSTRPRLRVTGRALREWYAWAHWRLRQSPLPVSIRVELRTDPPSIAPDGYTERFSRGPVWPRWSGEHVAWRYLHHPYFTYRFAAVFNGSTCLGFAVVRRDGHVTRLVDLYGPHGALERVVGGIARGLEGPIEARFVGRSIEGLFRRAGWATFRAGGQLMGRSSDPALHHLLLDRDWCFFAGDSDSDRLRTSEADARAQG